MKLESIVIASSNSGKIAEMKEIFKGVKVLSLTDIGFLGDIEETGETLKENALIKAKTICEQYNVPTLADDSGLCVNALGGAPGVYSARYSGKGTEGNKALLLKNLEGVDDRSAYFACCICLYYPDGTVFFGEGKTEGYILEEEHGTGGFGYDPLFYSNDLNKPFGLATPEEKNSVSHRFRAIDNLLKQL